MTNNHKNVLERLQNIGIEWNNLLTSFLKYNCISQNSQSLIETI
jgi:hypothetical protein